MVGGGGGGRLGVSRRLGGLGGLSRAGLLASAAELLQSALLLAAQLLLLAAQLLLLAAQLLLLLCQLAGGLLGPARPLLLRLLLVAPPPGLVPQLESAPAAGPLGQQVPPPLLDPVQRAALQLHGQLKNGNNHSI